MPAGVRGLLIAVLAVGAAAWWAWPSDVTPRHTFAVPDRLQVQFPHGEGVAQSLYTSGGRIHAARDLTMVVTPFVDPVSVSVEDLQGAGELRFGLSDGVGASVVIGADGLELRVRGAAPASHAFPLARPRNVALRYDGGSYAVLADGRKLEPELPGELPSGPATLVLSSAASLQRLTATNATGDVRIIEDSHPPHGFELVYWASASALLLLAALSGWWRLVAGGWEPGALERFAGFACTLGLSAGLLLTLRANNGQRLGAAPAPCDDRPFTLAAAPPLLPGQPYQVPGRRDGDFRLSARVALEPDSVVDVLLRASPSSVDEQILLTLSNDASLPSGFSRNHSLFLQNVPAPAETLRLPAGRPLLVELLAEDATVEASVDGRPLGRISDFDLRAGRTAFQVLSGSATLSDLRIEPVRQPRALDGRLATWEYGAAALGVLGVLFMARRCGRGWAAALAIAPLSVVAQPLAPPQVIVPGLVAGALVIMLTPLRGGRVLTCAGGAALIGLTFWVHDEKPILVTPTTLSSLRPADVAGPPLPARYVWARHPLCRRYNGYVRTQEFRDRHVTPEKGADALRIAAVGSSSTFGYGVAAPQCWASQLEVLLAAQVRGRKVEVINAGVPDSTAERLRPFLQGVVLPLHPDIVIIDLGFGDRTNDGSCDEREHFRRMASDGISWWQRLLQQWKDHRAAVREQAFRNQIMAGQPVDPDDVQRFETEPAERFAASLREMVAACRAAGAQVVLVEEPVRKGVGDRTLQAFRAAMAGVGSDLAVPVVSPQAALDDAGGELFVDHNHDFVCPNAAGHRIIARLLAETVSPLLTGPR